MRLLSDSDGNDSSRNVVCLFKGEGEGCLELGSGLALSDPEVDSTAAARSQINPGKEPEVESGDAAFRELQELLSEPEPLGSKDGSRASSKSKPKVGMSFNKGKKSGSYPKIAD